MNVLNFNQIDSLTYIYILIAFLIITLSLLVRSYQRSKRKNRELGKINRSHRILKNQVTKLSANIKMNAVHNKKIKSSNKYDQQNHTSDNSQIKSLKNELRQWKRRVPPLIDRYKTLSLKNKKLNNELVEVKRVIALSEVMNSPDKTKTVINLNNYRSRENLQEIRGIGPSIEKTLNHFDIFRFNQIVAISDYEIEAIARKIKGFKSQIYREDWIGQAEIMVRNKTSETERSN
jgi:predicted flap endonuclease-1-like 5' DNA nuclease